MAPTGFAMRACVPTNWPRCRSTSGPVTVRPLRSEYHHPSWWTAVCLCPTPRTRIVFSRGRRGWVIRRASSGSLAVPCRGARRSGTPLATDRRTRVAPNQVGVVLAPAAEVSPRLTPIHAGIVSARISSRTRLRLWRDLQYPPTFVGEGATVVWPPRTPSTAEPPRVVGRSFRLLSEITRGSCPSHATVLRHRVKPPSYQAVRSGEEPRSTRPRPRQCVGQLFATRLLTSRPRRTPLNPLSPA